MNEELSRRAVACRGWRWLPGVLTNKGRCQGVWKNTDRRVESVVVVADIEGVPSGPMECRPLSVLPDLDDPATLGCLLALVREAWEAHRGESPQLGTICTGDKWGVGVTVVEGGQAILEAVVLPSFYTEAEALVAALEAAP